MCRKVTKFPIQPNLRDRERVEIELPGFLLRALELRVTRTNEGAPEPERVDLNELIEFQLAESVSIAEIANLERELPGVGAAVSEWLRAID